MKLFNAIAAAAVIGMTFVAVNPLKAGLGEATKKSQSTSYDAWCGAK